MRIGYLIGSISSGGSERQLCELARGMAARGHVVEVGAYDGVGLLDRQLMAAKVRVRHGSATHQTEKLHWARRWVSEFRPDVVHGVMKRASSLAVLTSLPSRRYPVIASDLSTATYSRTQPALWAALALFAFARRVCTQTETNKRSLVRLAPWLRRKVTIIRNGCDTNRYAPSSQVRRNGRFRFLCSGTVYGVKNPLRVVNAVASLSGRGLDVSLDWAGNTGPGGVESSEYRSAINRVAELGLAQSVKFMGLQTAMEQIYPQYDALVHASLQEGIPNAVVEAMACGLPVVVSRVSDLPLIVRHGRNGVLCEATSVTSIAAAMESMVCTTKEELAEMGRRSRSLAVDWFGRSRFLDEYEALYEASATRHP